MTQTPLARRLGVVAIAIWATSTSAQTLPPGPRLQRDSGPPPQAYEECRDRALGASVRLRTPTGILEATCKDTPDGFLAVPNDHLRRQTPPPQAYEDCVGRSPGDKVSHRTPNGMVKATCVRSPQGLVARPYPPLEAQTARQRQPQTIPALEPAPASPSFPAATRPEAEPPKVLVSPVPPTTAQIVDIAGKVSAAGRITAVMMDGAEIPVASNGDFSVRRGIPLGDSEINVVAIDEWGRRGEARVGVRRMAASNDSLYPPLMPAQARGKVRPDALALIIGVENYKSAPPAEFAENDAKAFYDYAVKALGVPASRVKLLTGGNAQKVDVDAAILTWLKPLIAKDRSEVFIFFSGHGLASDDGKDLFLLPQDGNRTVLDRSAIRRKELIEMIIDSEPKSATLFLDTCYSGGTRGKENLVASARPILVMAKEQTVPPNVTILAAAGNDQLSSSLVAAKHGLFSYFLMKGLEGDAADSDRTITAAKLEAYLSEKIPVEAAKLGRTQTPQLIGDGSRVISSW